MFDAHAHLQDIPQNQLPAFVQSMAASSAVRCIFCNAASLNDWEPIVGISAQLHSCISFFGVHPWFSSDLPDDWEYRLEQRLAKKKCGIGEIGLDKVRSGLDFETQKFVFAQQVKLAGLTRKVFSVHCAGAWGPLLAILKNSDLNGVPFILHGFSGSGEVAGEIVKLGGFISLGPKNLDPQKLKILCAQIPAEHLLVETDFSKASVSEGVDVAFAEYYVKTLQGCYQRVAAALNMDLPSFSAVMEKNEDDLMGYV